MSNRLQGRVALVTGAGGGIGRAEALALAAEGARVVVNDIGTSVTGVEGQASRTPAEEVVAEIGQAGGEAVPNFDSVADHKAAERMIQATLDAFGRLDILVNNAGVLQEQMVWKISDEQWDREHGVHLKGAFNTIKFAAQLFRQQKSGRIVNTASPAGLGAMGHASYASAKEGVVGLTRTVAKDLGRYGVTCNAIRPAARTRMTVNPDLEANLERMREMRTRPGQFADPMLEEIVLAGEGLKADLFHPGNVAAFVVWLCTDAARRINGRTFFVGGDRIALYSEPTAKSVLCNDGPWALGVLDALFDASFLSDDMNPNAPEQ